MRSLKSFSTLRNWKRVKYRLLHTWCMPLLHLKTLRNISAKERKHLDTMRTRFHGNPMGCLSQCTRKQSVKKLQRTRKRFPKFLSVKGNFRLLRSQIRTSRRHLPTPIYRRSINVPHAAKVVVALLPCSFIWKPHTRMSINLLNRPRHLQVQALLQHHISRTCQARQWVSNHSRSWLPVKA